MAYEMKVDAREKLVEFIRCADYHPCGGSVRKIGSMFTTEFIEDIASQLIANGVTVQEWISQTELPWMGEEIAKLCIRYMEDYADFHGYASSKKVKAHIVRLLELEKDGRIAILPQPPKGE